MGRIQHVGNCLFPRGDVLVIGQGLQIAVVVVPIELFDLGFDQQVDIVGFLVLKCRIEFSLGLRFTGGALGLNRLRTSLAPAARTTPWTPVSAVVGPYLRLAAFGLLSHVERRIKIVGWSFFLPLKLRLFRLKLGFVRFELGILRRTSQGIPVGSLSLPPTPTTTLAFVGTAGRIPFSFFGTRRRLDILPHRVARGGKSCGARRFDFSLFVTQASAAVIDDGSAGLGTSGPLP